MLGRRVAVTVAFVVVIVIATCAMTVDASTFAPTTSPTAALTPAPTVAPTAVDCSAVDESSTCVPLATDAYFMVDGSPMNPFDPTHTQVVRSSPACNAFGTPDWEVSQTCTAIVLAPWTVGNEEGTCSFPAAPSYPTGVTSGHDWTLQQVMIAVDETTAARWLCGFFAQTTYPVAAFVVGVLNTYVSDLEFLADPTNRRLGAVMSFGLQVVSGLRDTLAVDRFLLPETLVAFLVMDCPDVRYVRSHTLTFNVSSSAATIPSMQLLVNGNANLRLVAFPALAVPGNTTGAFLADFSQNPRLAMVDLRNLLRPAATLGSFTVKIKQDGTLAKLRFDALDTTYAGGVPVSIEVDAANARLAAYMPACVGNTFTTLADFRLACVAPDPTAPDHDLLLESDGGGVCASDAVPLLSVACDDVVDSISGHITTVVTELCWTTSASARTLETHVSNLAALDCALDPNVWIDDLLELVVVDSEFSSESSWTKGLARIRTVRRVVLDAPIGLAVVDMGPVTDTFVVLGGTNGTSLTFSPTTTFRSTATRFEYHQAYDLTHVNVSSPREVPSGFVFYLDTGGVAPLLVTNPLCVGNMTYEEFVERCDTYATHAPSLAPSTLSPSHTPSATPSHAPTSTAPSHAPSTLSPTHAPSASPSHTPSTTPTTSIPSHTPTSTTPSKTPSATPTATGVTHTPSTSPSTSHPSRHPSRTPSRRPSRSPSRGPSRRPSRSPSRGPSRTPSRGPSRSPSRTPSRSPSNAPSHSPSRSPSQTPSRSPSNAPSICEPRHTTIDRYVFPTRSPTLPSSSPSRSPSRTPTTRAPSRSPTRRPTKTPTTPRPTTKTPSRSPSQSPSRSPRAATRSPGAPTFSGRYTLVWATLPIFPQFLYDRTGFDENCGVGSHYVDARCLGPAYAAIAFPDRHLSDIPVQPLDPVIGLYSIEGTLIANSWSAFVSGPWVFPLDGYGGVFNPLATERTPLWTGADAAGHFDPDHSCASWTSSSSALDGTAAAVNSTNAGSIASLRVSCDQALSYMCVCSAGLPTYAP